MPEFDLLKAEQSQDWRYENKLFIGGSQDHLMPEKYISRKRTRYLAIAVVFVVVALALAIGLGVGLSKSSSEDNNTSGDTDAQHQETTPSTSSTQSSTRSEETTVSTTTSPVHSETGSPRTSTLSTGSSSASAATTTVHIQTTQSTTTISTESGTTPGQSTTIGTTDTRTPASTTPEPQPTTTTTPTSVPQTTEHVDWLSQPCIFPDQLPQCPWSENPVLLVSLDGFRADYLLRNHTPVIEKLRTCGVHTPYMRAAYPTLTFPNHYTIVTGLYPESHGIVGNHMYDHVINASFSLSGHEKNNPEWWGGEPLWTTAKKQGKKTASFFWVGSDVNISGSQPDIWKKYDGSISFEDRVDTVIDWLRLPEGDRPDFITLYFDEPDHTGHGSGPNSPQVDAMLGRVDGIIRRLMDGLLRQRLDHCTNVIVLADHGMAETSCQRQVVLDKYEKRVQDMLVFSGTTGHINTQYAKHHSIVTENEEVVPAEEVASSLQCKNSHLKVFTKETIPVRHHYTNNERIGDVILDIEDTWLVYPSTSHSCLHGNHGYDNIYKSMHALFLAHGPNFQQNIEIEPFENIELYILMSELLNIVPSNNNGTLGSLHHLLRNVPTLPQTDYTTGIQPCSTTTTRNDSACSCQNKPAFHPTAPPTEVNSEHFPLGMPWIEEGNSTCTLHGNQYSMAFSKELKMPMIVFFQVTRERVSAYNGTTDTCMVIDPRLDGEADPPCTNYTNPTSSIQYGRLFDPGFASTDEDVMEALLSSNKVPMYQGFKDGIWAYQWRVIQEYATKYGSVHVTVGPIFDQNSDGLADSGHDIHRYVSNSSSVPLPSHFYTILTKCRNQSTELSQCKVDQLDISAFVLPHQNSTANCLPDKNFLRNNVARVRDIELLTGVQMLTRFDRATAARLSTFLPTELWPSPLLTAWVDLPCPIPDDSTCPPGSPPLLLISLDGFRADYLDRHLTPVIQRLSQCGVHTPFMRAVYPTVTFPNHYTIVTGLYPESHGIISNTMYDPEIDKVFTLSASTAKDPRWWKGEPLWVTAQKQGLKTATYFWPGSDVNISGIYPDIYKPYDGSAGYTQRVYEVLDWLSLPADTRPDFITLYFDEPDHAGHNSGPDSDEVNGQLETVDELLDILMTNLYEKNLHSCVNMVVLADHGMSKQSCEKTVELEPIYPDISNMLSFDRVMGQIFPGYGADGHHDVHTLNQSYVLDDIVSNLSCKHSAMKVFTKATLPRRHHYTSSRRIGDVLLDMRNEWLVLDHHTSWCTGGNHGWDNTYKNMHALFLAHGPAFKENFTAEPFENIELYDMMSEVLGIDPAPNNGTIGSLHYILRSPKPLPNVTHDSDYRTCSATIPTTVSAMCDCNVSALQSSDVFRDADDDVLSFGVPRLILNDSVCVLYQHGYSIGYSDTFKSPVWLSTIMSNQTMLSSKNSTCVINDTRVSRAPSVSCDLYDNVTIGLTPLLTTGISHQKVRYDVSSALVPMYAGFRDGIWAFLQDLIEDYIHLYGQFSVTSGVIYDYNSDGLWEGITNDTECIESGARVPIPTHIYVILIKCQSAGQGLPCGGKVDILPFIIPHLPEAPNCLSSGDYLKDNVARLRDIELLTGLQFMTSYNTSSSARMRTFLPERLWDNTLIRDWSELPCPQEDLCQSDYRPLLLISLDGFRADYLIRNFTPTIARLSQCGVHAPYMRSVYPTKTFPNHYSIVTGLYPESHGIIDNNMYDLDIGQRFYLGSATSGDARWWGGDPLWLTAKRQGRTTATYFWPGSDVPIQGEHPNIYKKYDGSVSYSNRVHEVLSWMMLPADQRPDFITLYFDEPDLAGHKYGPSNTEQIGAALERVDDTILELMEGLVDKNLHHCVNLVIIADHGMADVSCHNVVRLRDFVDYDYLSSNTYVWEAPTDKLVSNLTCADPHLSVYRKSTLPVRHHYSNNDRIDDILLDMDSGYLVTRSYINTCRGGNHGYDNIEKSMEALFLAYGPAFKWNMTVDPFENIELYNMFADILNITASRNNGTMGTLNHLLQNPRSVLGNEPLAAYSNVSIQFDGEASYVTYVKASACFQKTCPNISEEMVGQLYRNLSRVTPDPDQAPMGVPSLRQVAFSGREVALLHQPGFVLGYDQTRAAPVWMSQTLSKSEMENDSVDSIHCSIPDPRQAAKDQQDCSMNNTMVTAPLTVSGKMTGSLFRSVSSSNIRLLAKFVDDILEPLYHMIRELVSTYRQVNVVTGPVYDSNHDSLPDIGVRYVSRYITYRQVNVATGPVYDSNHDSLPDLGVGNSTLPSHMFAVVTRCEDPSEDLKHCTSYKTSSYILPHIRTASMCKGFQHYLLENEARARDVELVTGLQLFTSLPDEQAIKMRVYLPTKLWT